ncbi:MAG TPA: hypothetical protein DCS93_07040 [Microscillaceae bacterium]|nr:hypothetical protein [Microscillaceae bacterium]
MTTMIHQDFWKSVGYFFFIFLRLNSVQAQQEVQFTIQSGTNIIFDKTNTQLRVPIFYVNQGGTLSLNGTIHFENVFLMNGTFKGSKKVISVIGSGDKLIFGNVPEIKVDEFIMQSDALNDQLSTNINISVKEKITLNTGKLVVGNNVYLFLEENAIISGGSAKSFVEGKLSKKIATNNTTFSFPIGKNNTWGPLTLTTCNGTTSTTTFTAEFFDQGFEDFSNPNTIKAFLKDRYWNLSRDSGGFNAKIKISWSGKLDFSDDLQHWSDLAVARYNGEAWQPLDVSTVNVNNNEGFMITREEDKFGILTIGSENPENALGNVLITGFSHSSGEVGEIVRIDGKNFSVIKSENVVKFNNVIASDIISATQSQLNVKIPIGASSGKVEVTTQGQTAISEQTFTIVNSNAPIISINGASNLKTFTAPPSFASTSQEISVTGTNLIAPIKVNASSDFEVSTLPTDEFNSELTLPSNNGQVNSTIYIRYTPQDAVQNNGIISFSSNNASIQQINVSGNPVASLSISKESLTKFVTVKNQTSASRSFIINAVNIDSLITIEAPSNFELSSDNQTYTRLLNISPINQLIRNQQVYVRYKRNTVGLDLNKSILIKGRNFDTQTITVNGEAVDNNAPNLTISPLELPTFLTLNGTTTQATPIILNGFNINTSLLIKTSAPFEIAEDTLNFTDSLLIEPNNEGILLNKRIYVRFYPSAIGTQNDRISFYNSEIPEQIILLEGNSLDPSAPTITDFTPKSGRPGTLVTIVGNNFSPIKSQNKVIFNGATVLDNLIKEASKNYLVAEVPMSASGTGAVQVLVNDNGGVSNSNFSIENANTTIAPIRNLASTAQGRHQVLLEWEMGDVVNTKKVVIERSKATENNFQKIYELTDLTNSSFVDNMNLEIGAIYYYRLFAKGINKESASSSITGILLPRDEFVTSAPLTSQNNNIKVYPNPSSNGKFNIQINQKNSPKYPAILVDSRARLIRHFDKFPNEIDLSNCTSGWYYLIIRYNQEKFHIRLIKI